MTSLLPKNPLPLDDTKVVDLNDAKVFNKEIEVLCIDDRFDDDVLIICPVDLPILDVEDKVIGHATVEKVGASLFAKISIEYSTPERLNLEVDDYVTWIRWDECHFSDNGKIDTMRLHSIKLAGSR